MITNEGAYVISQSVCAMIEAMGMQAENGVREARREMPAYHEDDFVRLVEKYGIGHDAVTESLSK